LTTRPGAAWRPDPKLVLIAVPRSAFDFTARRNCYMPFIKRSNHRTGYPGTSLLRQANSINRWAGQFSAGFERKAACQPTEQAGAVIAKVRIGGMKTSSGRQG
jgi:hypothetical protein